MAASQSLVSHGWYPLASEEEQSQNGSEANVNKHVFIEQNYVQYPICSALDCADTEHGGNSRKEQLTERWAAKKHRKSR